MRRPPVQGLRQTLYLVCILSALQSYYGVSNKVPETVIMEEILCQKHYAELDSGIVTDCKIPQIQSDLAYLMSWRQSLGQLPGILLAPLYSTLADSEGRKYVLILFCVGILLSDLWTKLVYLYAGTMSIRWVLLGPILQSIGGGGQVGDFVVCTVLADIVPEKDRVRAFLQLSAFDLAAETVAMAASSSVTKVSPWYALIIGLASLLLQMLLTIFLLPDTRHSDRSDTPTSWEQPPDNDEGDAVEHSARARSQDVEALRLKDGPERDPLIHESAADEADVRLLAGSQEMATYQDHGPRSSTISAVLSKTRSTLSGLSTFQDVLQNMPTLKLLLVFGLACATSQSMQLILQCASIKLGWDISEAGLIDTLQILLRFVTVVLILPVIDRRLTSSQLSAYSKDRIIAIGSCACLAAGYLFIGASAEPVVFALGLAFTSLGTGFLIALRSMMTSLVPPQSTSALYTTISVVHGTAAAAAGPVFAFLFKTGLSMAVRWSGLPYFAAGTIHVAALLGI